MHRETVKLVIFIVIIMADAFNFTYSDQILFLTEILHNAK